MENMRWIVCALHETLSFAIPKCQISPIIIVGGRLCASVEKHSQSILRAVADLALLREISLSRTPILPQAYDKCHVRSPPPNLLANGGSKVLKG